MDRQSVKSYRSRGPCQLFGSFTQPGRFGRCSSHHQLPCRAPQDCPGCGNAKYWRLFIRSLEFLRFIAAPKASGETFELATDIKEESVRNQFLENGWRLSLPHDLSSDWNLYRRFLQGSKGEFTVAKDQYVRLNTGWFSDRTACYLACGRPAITQETGFTRFYGGQRGLFSFRTLEEIPEAVREINADYAAHCQAAWEVAHEYFEAEKVLADLLERAGV